MSKASIKSGPGKAKFVGLVRDENGNPVFDDYNNIDPRFKQIFTVKDVQYIKKMQRIQNGEKED